MYLTTSLIPKALILCNNNSFELFNLKGTNNIIILTKYRTKSSFPNPKTFKHISPLSQQQYYVTQNVLRLQFYTHFTCRLIDFEHTFVTVTAFNLQ